MCDMAQNVMLLFLLQERDTQAYDSITPFTYVFFVFFLFVFDIFIRHFYTYSHGDCEEILSISFYACTFAIPISHNRSSNCFIQFSRLKCALFFPTQWQKWAMPYGSFCPITVQLQFCHSRLCVVVAFFCSHEHAHKLKVEQIQSWSIRYVRNLN